MAQKMHTDQTIWTYDEKETKWYGVCVECKGEKAKYTPQNLVEKNIKPCGTCSDMKRYEEAKKMYSMKKEKS